MTWCSLAQANFTCAGGISYLGVNSLGTVYVAVGPFGIWPICGLTGSMSNGGSTVGMDSCKAWYAALLAQKAAGQGVTLYFTSTANTANGPECTALTSWVVPNPLPYHIDYQ